MALNSVSLRLTLTSLNEVVGALFIYTRKMGASMDAVLLVVRKEEEKSWKSQRRVVSMVEIEAGKARLIMGRLPRVLLIGNVIREKLISAEPAMPYELYMASIMLAVHDLIFTAEIREDGAAASSKKGKRRPGPWVAFAAATGLDPTKFNPAQQRQLVSCIQKDFPDPHSLVAMIIENPSDPRLNFEHLVEAGGLGLDARVAILEQRLEGCKVVEKRVEMKLKAARRKNASWKAAIMASLGVTQAVVFSDEDSDWIDDVE